MGNIGKGVLMELFDLFEIMHTTRSMRRLKPDPVPNDLLNKVLEAGTCAASGGNQQTWRFLVIRDPAIRAAASVYYRRGWHEVVGPRYRAGGAAPGLDRALSGRTSWFRGVNFSSCSEHAVGRQGAGSWCNADDALSNPRS